MSSNDFAKLPEKLSEIKTVFPGLSFKNILKKHLKPASLSPCQSLIKKYMGGALLAGRPLNSTLIFMAGASGAGKSATVNALFDDSTLCATSENASETTDVVLIQKQLKVSGEKLPVVGNLSFVDVPGTFDTDSKNEAVNLASIRKFVDNCVELAPRNRITKLFPMGLLNLSETTFPNIVLFVVRATENRLSGPDSFFRKSLKAFNETAQLIDVKRPNLIIVITHVMSLPRNKERFTQKLAEKTANIRRIVFEELGLIDVDVVPVENEPEDYDLEKSGDFYTLPDGQLSHCNLFEAMLRRFDKNEDLLSTLLVGWYFQPSCPERKHKATVVKSPVEVSNEDIALAELSLSNLNICVSGEESLASFYNFQSLGRGYCPVTEEVKPVSLLSDDTDNSSGTDDAKNKHLVKIENSKFFIPKCVTPYVKSCSRFHCITFFDKNQYEGHMQASYGFEAGFKLIVSANSEGRWVNDSAGHSSTALVSLVQEMQVATFKLDNPKINIKSKAFLDDLNNLPDTFSNDTANQFQAFFSKWGTHLIYEQALGGAVQLNCIIQKADLTQDKLKEVEGKVSGMYRAFTYSAEGSYEENSKVMQEAGLSNESFQIYGGISPGIVTLASINSKFLANWSQTVGESPAELRKSIKLYPYYNLLESGNKFDSLRQATKDYLQNTFEAKVKDVVENTREKMGQKALENAVNTNESNCFPIGTQLLLENGGNKAIEDFNGKWNPNVATFKLKSKLESFKLSLKTSQGVTGTKFCTYLDYKKDIRVEYLVFRFTNGKELRVSEAHLIFEFLGSNAGQIRGKQAKYFKVGEMMVYFSKGESENGEGTGFETPFIQEIGRETLSGAFSPLTTSGTFFADGFLVTSYANIDSFSTAQASLLPLKMWSQMKNRKAKKMAENLKPEGCDEGKETNLELSKNECKQGIHPYAQFFIGFRKSFTRRIPALKKNH